MNTLQFEKLIQHVTGRPLTLEISQTEIPLESKVVIRRPYKQGEAAFAFEWQTPKKEDSLLRSFITTFCSKYLEPDPDTYDRKCPVYGDTWEKYESSWKNPETHWSCSPWHHHRSHMMSKDKLRSQIIANFANFDSSMARLGFYHTHYGIGIFTIYGGSWVRHSLAEMAAHLNCVGIPFRNELSDAGWVTRFVLNLNKESHGEILGSF